MASRRTIADEGETILETRQNAYASPRQIALGEGYSKEYTFAQEVDTAMEATKAILHRALIKFD